VAIGSSLRADRHIASLAGGTIGPDGRLLLLTHVACSRSGQPSLGRPPFRRLFLTHSVYGHAYQVSG